MDGIGTRQSIAEARRISELVIVVTTVIAVAVTTATAAGLESDGLVFSTGTLWVLAFLASLSWVRTEVSGAALAAVCAGLALVAITDGTEWSGRRNWGLEVAGSAFLAGACLALWVVLAAGRLAYAYADGRGHGPADRSDAGRATARRELARRAIVIVLIAALVVAALSVAWTNADTYGID